jgi:hypothetical protein
MPPTRHSFFTSLAILSFAFLAAGCAAKPNVTASPATARTTRPAPTATVTATLQPAPTSTFAISSLPSFSPSNKPDRELSGYQLRVWTEVDSIALLQGFQDLVKDKQDQVPYDMVSDYSVAFQSERLLRYPDSPARTDVLWDILLNKPEVTSIPGIQPTHDLMSFLISGILAQNVKPADLPTELEKHHAYVDKTVTIKNLTGNGADSIILVIKIPDAGMTGVFAVFQDGEKFRVAKVRNWDVSEAPALGRYFEVYDVGDTNGNGLPELVVQIKTGGSGDPQIWKESIDDFEWSAGRGEFLSQSFPVFWQSCDESGQGPCEGDWKFSKNGSQSVLTTQSYWFTHESCPNLTIQRLSAWDGEQYIPGNPAVVPPGDDLTPECRLAWAETAIWMPAGIWEKDITETGWENGLAISIVEHSLKNWPALADEWWGPASRDYFKLRLGIWRELRNEGSQAKSLLQQVASNPSHVQYNFASRLASLYLQKRASSGAAKACLALDDAFTEEFRKIVPEPSRYNNDKETLAAWGFARGHGSLCDIYEMLPVDAQNARMVSADLLNAWLKKTAFTVYQNEPVDLNGDGLQDRLLVLDTIGYGSGDPWAFLGAPDGFKAVFISDMSSESEQQLVMKIRSINTGDVVPTLLISLGDRLNIFRITPHSTIESLVDEYSVQTFEVVDQASPAKILVKVDGYSGKRTTTYLWDSKTKNFVEHDDFAIAQAEIENLLYIQKDYRVAIVSINSFLQTAPPEPTRPFECGVDIPGGCRYRPDWYIPYFRYLLGVSYELSGQSDQAKQVYYELWRDDPKNIFGIAASQKLMPAKP